MVSNLKEMQMKFLIFLTGFVNFFFAVSAQCVERNYLEKRLLFFRDSAAIAPSRDLQLKELLNYAASMKNCAYRFDSTHSLLLQRIGVLYNKQSNHVQAINYIKQSNNIIISNSGGSSINQRYLIRNYYILYGIYDSLGRVSESMKALDSCILYSINLNSPDDYTLYALKIKAEYLYDIGEYNRAIESSEMGESIIRQYFPSRDSIGYSINFLTWKVNALLTLKDFNKAEAILDNKIEECQRTGAKKYIGTIYELLAEVKAGQGLFDKATLMFELAYYNDLKVGEKLGCKQILNNWAYIIYFNRNRDYDKAIATYKKALRFLREHELKEQKEPFEAVNLYGNIAYVFVHDRQYDSAFLYFQKAFDQIRPGMNESDVLVGSVDTVHYKRIRYLVSLLIEKGEAYSKRYNDTKQKIDIQEAIRIYKITDQFLDMIRAVQSEVTSMLFWRADNRRLYENAIEACYQAGNADMAFLFFEKSRAVLLHDQLNEQHWLTEKEIFAQAQVKKKILHLESEFETASFSSSRYKTLEKELFTAKQELNEIIRNIKSTNPLYFQSFVDSAFVSLLETKNYLAANFQTLLELFIGDSTVYVQIITKDNNYFNKISKVKFEEGVNSFIRHITDQSLLNHDFQRFINSSNELYQLIFQNINLPLGRLIISPDGAYFPFEALVTKVIEGDPIYLLEGHAVSYTYSARYLTNAFSTNVTSSSPQFLGVAPVKFVYEPRLASLEASDRSVKRIAQYFSGGEELTGETASRASFLNQYYKYKVIQLYAHAADSSAKGEPVIWLADSALYLSDLIGEIKPITRLIVLSACETGSGRFYLGEGVFSFNRGFAALGIPSAVTNLWSVDSKSTYQLTELFYKYLAEGITSDIALQKAKLEFIRENDQPLPFYWAAPILTGKAEVIELKKSFNWQWILLGIGIVLVSGLVWWRIKRNAN